MALGRLARSSRRGEADRARAILRTLEGQRAEDIAVSLGANVSTVREWRGLYARGGVEALRYRRASGGRPGTVGRQALALAQTILVEDMEHDLVITAGSILSNEYSDRIFKATGLLLAISGFHFTLLAS